MPGADGFELIRELRLTVRTPTGDPVYSSGGVVSEGDVVITP